jgi:hypothetical protein
MVIRFANFSRPFTTMGVFDNEKEKPTLSFRVVPLDQSLKARIAS